mmetsp:Transcript_51962/g.111068  ORF Transcript_51962/g.111068 Transcript_51962/m.111068 type:complete len:202 (+) Transcript_51962:897-1502(+)
MRVRRLRTLITSGSSVKTQSCSDVTRRRQRWRRLRLSPCTRRTRQWRSNLLMLWALSSPSHATSSAPTVPLASSMREMAGPQSRSVSLCALSVPPYTARSEHRRRGSSPSCTTCGTCRWRRRWCMRAMTLPESAIYASCLLVPSCPMHKLMTRPGALTSGTSMCDCAGLAQNCAPLVSWSSQKHASASVQLSSVPASRCPA